MVRLYVLWLFCSLAAITTAQSDCSENLSDEDYDYCVYTAMGWAPAAAQYLATQRDPATVDAELETFTGLPRSVQNAFDSATNGPAFASLFLPQYTAYPSPAGSFLSSLYAVALSLQSASTGPISRPTITSPTAARSTASRARATFTDADTCDPYNDFCYETSVGWNSAAADYLNTVSFDEAILTQAAENLQSAPASITRALATEENEPAEFSIIRGELSLIQEPARSFYSSLIEVVFSYQSQSAPARVTGQSTTPTSAVFDLGSNVPGSGSAASTANSSPTGPTMSGQTTQGTQVPQSASAAQSSSSRAAAGTVARPTDIGLMAMAGVVAGVAGLAYGL